MHQGRWHQWGTLIFIIWVNLQLTGCMNIAATGAQAIYQHRSLQRNLNDSYITLKINHDIQEDKKLKESHITVATYHSIVLLAGQAPAEWQRQLIEKNTKNIEGVKRVYNFIEIAQPLSALKKISDTWLTAKIKAKFIASNELDVTNIKVVTENGTVYLMGTLLRDEAEAAIAIASETDGVEKVVKIFSYLQILPSQSKLTI